jgi:choline-glycine betaine transporter
LLLLALVLSLLDRDNFLSLFTGVNDWILERFDWLYNITSFAMVLLCMAIYFSPLGRQKIGGSKAMPILTKWRWFSIIICTTIAVGILFWGTSEPLYHLSQPPKNAHGDAAFAMSSLFIHWSFTPYAIYTIPALLFALGFYNRKMNYSLSAMLFPFGKFKSVWLIKLLDAICLFALIAGMAAVIGVGMLSISGGISGEFKSDKPLLLLAIGSSLVMSFTISAATGLLKGIRILSAINIFIFIVIAFAVFILGPTRYIISNAIDGLVTMGHNFVPQSLGIGQFNDEKWMHSWTSFYWANWMAWAPITAMFLGRIAIGYTVRQFVLFNWLIPSLFGIIWMSVFGGTSLFLELEQNIGLIPFLEEKGPESIIYVVFSSIPAAKALSVLFLLTVFLSFVTAADSNTEAMASISTEGITYKSSSPPVYIKVIWGIVIGLVGWVMVSFAGIDGVKMLSNLGGFPALFLMIALCLAMVKLLLSSKRSEFKRKQ